MYKRQDKKTLKYTVTESVECLGILGKIIMDPDLTEVMINGYDTIFVEKSGKLMQLEEHFESSEDLERIVKRFVSSMDRTVDALSLIHICSRSFISMRSGIWRAALTGP